MTRGGLSSKFPGIPAPFPEQAVKFADFGQNLQKSVLENEKFAAKFAEAGNWDSPAPGLKRAVSLPGDNALLGSLH
jgi:hypothetical protein